MSSIEIITSDHFRKWLEKLKDTKARARVLARIEYMSMGNVGDVKPVGSGVSEARIHIGKGYRLYFIQQGTRLIVMLAGGDKSSQQRDIKLAKQMAKEWNEQ